MTTTTQTTAEQIALRLGSDGQTFEVAARQGEPVDPGASEEGHTSLDALAREAGGRQEWRDGWRTGDVYRWAFRDGSALTVLACGWDLGFTECYCWAGVGHDEACTARSEES